MTSVSRRSVEIVLQFVVRVILDFLDLLTGKISGNPCFSFFSLLLLFSFLSWQLCLVSLCLQGLVEEAHLPSSLLRPHLPPPCICTSISFPPAPSFLYAMAHTEHFICRLLDFPDAARLQPPSHADPAFYFAHTERVSGIKWPLVSADALFVIFIFLLARFCRRGLNCAKASATASTTTCRRGVAGSLRVKVT